MEELTNDNFKEKTQSGYAVLDFWAPWCGPCKAMGPIFEAVGEKLKDKALFAKVNVDENQDLAGQFGIMSIPTILILKDGQVKEKIMGAANTAADFENQLSPLVE